ncbi:sugar transporter [Geopyxis carbonaria]|nr:sugar transporter [Geopyxis carbonaria]
MVSRSLAIPPHTRRVFLSAAHVSLAGLLYGLDTGSIGPITEMSQFHARFGKLSSSTQGLYVASILLSASISSLASGHVADRISRRLGILTGGLLTCLGAIISATAPNFAALLCARLITGVGAGQAIAVATVYLVEIAPGGLRGVVACLLQLYVTVGIAAGYFVAFGAQTLRGDWAWRLPFVVQAAVAAVLVAGMVGMPYSPRWLVEHGRVPEAQAVLRRLRAPESVDAELKGIEDARKADERLGGARFAEMFQRRYVGRTALGVFLMAFQQLTGIDAVLYYAPILFQQAGFSSSRASFLASGVTGIVAILCTVPAQIYIDRWGRRKPLILGGTAMAACFAVIGAMYARFGEKHAEGVTLTSAAAQWVVVVLIYIFVANFSWSWAVVGKIYSAEIIPTRLRAKVCAVEQLANWMVNFVVALTAPVFLRSSPSGPYFLYGAATLLAAVVCVFMPETRGKSLEEIEGVFEKGRTAPTQQRL